MARRRNKGESGKPLLRSARSYAGLSIGAAVVTFALKFLAYKLTDSVGLLSDAMESVVNLTAAMMAFWMLTVASLPPDKEHTYGHSKAEYFSSGVEAMLILVAAGSIAWAAWGRLAHPQPLEHVWLGLAVSALAAAINGGVATVLYRASLRLNSITLRADGAHLMTDVYTSGGVIVAVTLVQATGWIILDPLIAFLVAVNIIWTGYRLMNDTLHGLLDSALPPRERQLVETVLDQYRERGVDFHAFRSRIAGQRRFISVHVLVPGAWTVQEGHNLVEQIEYQIHTAIPKCTVTTHVEPMEDPIAFADQNLDREQS
ncbi:MAG TPA: cation diffusion facilitator family transporter [Armatimonadota bacterium]|jgi:cation diffusion facilitator family transporter